MHGGSGVGTEGYGSSSSVADDRMAVDDGVHMRASQVAEAAPPWGRRPDYNSRKSTGKMGEGQTKRIQKVNVLRIRKLKIDNDNRAGASIETAPKQ